MFAEWTVRLAIVWK